MLANDEDLQFLFSMCDDKGKFIYEVAPDMFGPFLTIEESEYWLAFNLIRRAKMLDVDYQAISLEETLELIKREERTRKSRLKSHGKGNTRQIGSPRRD